MMKSIVCLTVGCLSGLGCLAAPDEDEEAGVVVEGLTGAARRPRSQAIRDVAASRGLTNGVLLAGIAEVETGLSHCWSEATWACQGPFSSSCGGPVIAGASDGPCSARQGGLGMFQFDGGTYEQTLARDGQGILQLDGNISHAVDFVARLVREEVSGVDTAAEAIAWMNSIPVVAGNARFNQWSMILSCRYNGRCNQSQANLYANATLRALGEFGAGFWNVSPPNTPPANLTSIDEEETVDLNGDGRADVCGRGGTGIYCATSSGSGFSRTSLWSAEFTDAGGWNAGPQFYSTIRLPDLNGDGRADICGRGIAGIYCALNTGTAFGATALWSSEFTDASGWSAGPQFYSTIRFPDVNGDGRADVCGRAAAGIHCALSSGSGFAATTRWSSDFTDAAGWAAGPQFYSTIRFPDLNGDGRADVCGRGSAGISCAVSSGTAFGAIGLWSSEFTDAGGWSAGPQYYSTIRFPDVNGDGRADVCGRAIAGIHCGISSGGGFAATTRWSSAFTDAGGWNAGPQFYSTIRFPDLNGDDRADVCGRGSAGISCGVSSGAAFGGAALWSSEFTDAAGWSAGPQFYSTLRFPDVNGDGRADVCGRGSAGISCGVSSGAAFGGAALWSSEYTDAAGWAFGPQYYSTIRFQ
jgi:hypothetical protein